MRFSVAAAFAAVFAISVALPAAGAPLESQTIALKAGWNAVYVEVAPQTPLDEVFAGWPVASVGFYDSRAFLTAAQFSEFGDSQGLAAPAFGMWHRDYPEATDAESLPAGTVCVCFATNAASVTVTGVPAAPRTTWHRTDLDDVYNFIGVSLQTGATVSPNAYLEGFPGLSAAAGKFYRIGGRQAGGLQLVPLAANTASVGDGDVILCSSGFVGSWPGALEVSPMSGLDFGSEGTLGTLTVKNRGGSARIVSLDIARAAGCRALDAAWLHVRDTSSTNSAWTALSDALPLSKSLEPDETWSLQFGLDRSSGDLASMVKGVEFGAILRVVDRDGPSRMRVDVPVTGAASGGAAASRAWPAGLWVADVAFDKVKGPGDAKATTAGGVMKVRLPIHIDANGKVRLLQRVVAAGTINPDDTWDYRLYAGTATPPATANTALRVSAVCLPTETPVVEATSAELAAQGRLVFDFTVAGDGSTSLLRHPLHPQHDNLRWDFKTPAPSGDDLDNYKYDVKPETFSVANSIELTLDMGESAARWNAVDAVGGACTWRLTGLRHEGPIEISGKASAKRVSPLAELVEQ